MTEHPLSALPVAASVPPTTIYVLVTALIAAALLDMAVQAFLVRRTDGTRRQIDEQPRASEVVNQPLVPDVDRDPSE